MRFIMAVLMIFDLFSCSQEKDPAVSEIINQYEFDCQIELNPLRKEFMNLSNTEEDLLRIVSSRNSILSNYAYKPMTQWIRRDDTAGEYKFTEELIYKDLSAPLKIVYERIEEIKKYQ